MQIKLLAHLIRAPESDAMKSVTFGTNFERLKADTKRVGRPRAKWLDFVMPVTYNFLESEGFLPENWNQHMETEEAFEILKTLAIEREF